MIERAVSDLIPPSEAEMVRRIRSISEARANIYSRIGNIIIETDRTTGHPPRKSRRIGANICFPRRTSPYNTAGLGTLRAAGEGATMPSNGARPDVNGDIVASPGASDVAAAPSTGPPGEPGGLVTVTRSGGFFLEAAPSGAGNGDLLSLACGDQRKGAAAIRDGAGLARPGQGVVRRLFRWRRRLAAAMPMAPRTTRRRPAWPRPPRTGPGARWRVRWPAAARSPSRCWSWSSRYCCPRPWRWPCASSSPGRPGARPRSGAGRRPRAASPHPVCNPGAGSFEGKPRNSTTSRRSATNFPWPAGAIPDPGSV